MYDIKNTQKRLLLEANLTLTKAVNIARSIEATEKQSTHLKEKGSPSTGQLLKVQTPQLKDRHDKQDASIRYRALGHQARDCHHINVEVFKCGKTGHPVNSRLPTNANTDQAKSNPKSRVSKWVEESSESEPTDQAMSKTTKPFTVELMVESTKLMFEIDTGTAVTLISDDTYNKQFSSKYSNPQ